MHAYNGKILDVELGDSPTCSALELSEEDVAKYIGGLGFAELFLARRMDWSLDAFDPRSIVAFMVGPLTGTVVPGCSRYVVAGKSPLGHWGEAHASGYWAGELKAAGFDGILISGAAPRPVYLYIHDGEVEVRDASHLWGLDTYEAEAAIREELGDAKVRVVGIGPAGENLSYMASVIGDEGRAAARSGMGALLGSKNLKAVAVRGSGKTTMHDEEAFRKVAKEILEKVKANATCGLLKQHGTPVNVMICAYFGDIPIKNWRLGDWPEGIPGLNAEAYQGILTRNWHCRACPVGCGRKIPNQAGKPPGLADVTGPEYECLAALGTMCMVSDMRTVAAAADLCNRLGMDAISAGTSIAFAMECFERGLIKPQEAEGISLAWGNGDALAPLLHKMAHREGWLGSLLADGTRAAAEKLGRDSGRYAIHCKGLELPMHDPKAFSGWSLAYGTTNRGACHLSATTYNIERGMTLPDIGLDQPLDRFSSEGKAAMVKTYHAFSAVLESLVACKFMVYTGLILSDFQSALVPATGREWTIEELMACGQRIYHLGRLINHTCGLSGEDDRMPERITGEPYQEGNAAGNVPEHQVMLEEYYRLQGWDEKGVPTVERIKELGLEEFAAMAEKARE